jgi:hypothetical protein
MEAPILIIVADGFIGEFLAAAAFLAGLALIGIVIAAVVAICMYARVPA